MKAKIKIITDVLMTLGILFVSGYQFWDDVLHEWVGTGLFVLFIAHNILNLRWYRGLFKRKYTAMGVVHLAVNFLLLIAMLLQMYSGIAMSRHVFDFLPFDSGLALVRRLHILGAYWGILLMGLHLELHWNMVLGMVRKRIKPQNTAVFWKVFCPAVGLLTAGYGVMAFIRRDFLTYLFLRSEFVFMDYGESPVRFYWDYLAIMGLCIFCAHYLSKNVYSRSYHMEKVL